MENRIITDAQITAIDYYNTNFYPYNGRLNNDKGWRSGNNSGDSWIQVDFLQTVTLTGIDIQSGRYIFTAWVTTLQIQYGDVEASLIPILESDEPKNFNANDDNDQIVRITFPEPINARILRILPTQWHQWPSLRFEAIGCPLDKSGYHNFQHDGGNNCLQNHDIAVFETKGLIRCGLQCIRRENCLSFNLQTTDTGINICTLNSAKRENVDNVHYVPVADCRYFYPV